MKIVLPSTPLAAPAAPSAAPAPVASSVSPEEVKTLQAAFQSLQKDLAQWRQAWQTEVDQRFTRLKEDIQKQTAGANESLTKSLQSLSQRIQQAEKVTVPSEAKIMNDLQAMLKQELQKAIPAPAPMPVAAPAPMPAAPPVDDRIKSAEDTMMELRRQLTTLPTLTQPTPTPAVSTPPVASAPAPQPTKAPVVPTMETAGLPDLRDPDADLDDEPEFTLPAEPIRRPSLISRLWAYLNEPALESRPKR